MNSSDNNFLSRWSRRKEEARQGADEIDAATSSPATSAEPATADNGARGNTPGSLDETGGRPDVIDEQPPRLTEKDFDGVDFDALDFNSDYQQFMGDGVPDSIRNKALRKLWTSNPVLANIDGLDDYCEDFSDAVWASPNIQTAYRVGRGFLTDAEVAEWENLGKPEVDKTAGDQDFADTKTETIAVECPPPPETASQQVAETAAAETEAPGDSAATADTAAAPIHNPGGATPPHQFSADRKPLAPDTTDTT